MPELPEVETVKKTLEHLILNKEISSVEVYYDKVLKNIEVNKFEAILIGQTFCDFRRKGKYLLFDLNDYTIVSHLRMEGKYNFNDEYEEKNKHDIFKIEFTDGSQVVYNDVRKFGTIEVVDLHKEEELKSINKLGPEPFFNEFNFEYLKNKAEGRNTPVKTFLLDQTVVTGLGNIYVDEVLFSSNISPIIKAGDLSDEQLSNIIDSSVKVLNKAIEEGGTTIKSFSVSGDVHGKFQHELNVYGRDGEHCNVCDSIIEKTKVGGRGTHYCPVCQKIK